MSKEKIIDKVFYRTLLPLVNDKVLLDILLSYADYRIETLRTLLETNKDPNRILEIQGAILELRRLYTLRDETLKGAE